MTEILPPDTSLAEAQAWLRERLEEGAPCPLCTQRAQKYRRKITGTSAAALIKMWRAGGTDFVHVPTVLGRKQADEAKMVYWGLIEEETILRPDGGRAGWWRVTDLGVDWIEGRVKMAAYAVVYDSRCLGLEPGEMVTIQEALGKRFDFAALMRGEG